MMQLRLLDLFRHEYKRYYPQIYLEEYFYELTECQTKNKFKTDFYEEKLSPEQYPHFIDLLILITILKLRSFK